MARTRGDDRSPTTPATAALVRAAVPFTVHAYDHDPRAVAAGGTYAGEAAAALGIEAARVFKTLVVDVDTAGARGGPGPAVAIVPADRHLDLKALAQALGGRQAAMADPVAAERATGYVLGGISPVGQRRPLPTVLDVSAQEWPTVFVSAGRRGLEIELSAADLLRVTSGVAALIARP